MSADTLPDLVASFIGDGRYDESCARLDRLNRWLAQGHDDDGFTNALHRTRWSDEAQDLRAFIRAGLVAHGFGAGVAR